jgi:hypothetical protein
LSPPVRVLRSAVDSPALGQAHEQEGSI